MHHISSYRYPVFHISNYSKILPIWSPQHRFQSTSTDPGHMAHYHLYLAHECFLILASLIQLFFTFLSKVPSYWCHKSVNDQTSLSFLTIHLAAMWMTKASRQNRAPSFASGVHCRHTEQRVAICCTLPMSTRSCLMWRLSWGSLARGSGGSNSPVKSSQLSRTKREKRAHTFTRQLRTQSEHGIIRRVNKWCRKSSLPFL